MRVAVYTIALNEEQFVEQWMLSALEADLILIGDTGSTDETVQLAKAIGIEVVPIRVSPWRFDDARNALLAQIPLDYDYCIALDMDEILVPGWREELNKLAGSGVTRPRYCYTWSWNDDGTPGLQYGGDKIHARRGYRWKHPVHEVLTPYGIEEVQQWTELQIEHHPDHSKSRSQYLPLLEMAMQEMPNDDRNAFYYARELFFHGRNSEAAIYFKRNIELSSWNAERSAACRFLAQCEPEQRRHWLEMALSLYYCRESLLALAEAELDDKNFQGCFNYAMRALEITDKPLEYLCETDAWSWKPHDLLSVSAYYLGDYKMAEIEANTALRYRPEDQRLQQNLEFCTTRRKQSA